MPPQNRTNLIAVATSFAMSALASCSSGSRSEPPAATAESAAPTASTSAAPTSSVAVDRLPPATLPVLKRERFAPDNVVATGLFPIQGALMVLVGDKRVARIVGDRFEFVDKPIPPGGPALGDHYIQEVNGRWPDEIGVIFANQNGRAPAPTYFPLTGKGMEHVAAGGGGLGRIDVAAPIGDSTIIARADMYEGVALVTVRGKTTRTLTHAADAGCNEDEVPPGFSKDIVSVAIEPLAIESTPAGSLVSVGRLCQKRAPAVEVWDLAGKARIVDLGRWWKTVSYSPRLLRGAGDELFLVSTEWQPILRFKDGVVDALPALDWPATNVATSPTGQLHVSDGQTIFRFDGAAWAPVALFDAPARQRAFAIEGETFWAFDAGLFKLTEASRGTFDATCKTPFVYLFDESYDDPPTYDYPHTREKLATFPGVADLALVEFGESQSKSIGVTVKSREQGEALIAFANEHMKDDAPFFVCYEPKPLRTFQILGDKADKSGKKPRPHGQ